MSDQRRPSPDDDTELLLALRTLGADYEPDVTAIARRAREPGAPAVVRHGRSVLLPAAAVLLLIGGIVLVISPGGDREPTALQIETSSRSSPNSGPSSKPADTVEPTTPANTAAPRVTATPDRSPPAATGASGRVTVSTRRVSPADGAFAVDLAKPPLIDWVAVGARADLKQIRAKAQIAKPLLTVEQPGPATSAPGPFSTSWNAGLPEQSHDGATSWLMAPAQPGLTVTVARSSESRTVKLFAGTRDVRGTLVVTGPGLAPKRVSLGPVSSQARGLVVTVVLPPTTGPTRLQLRGSPDGPTPRVYLAAATVTTR